MSPPRRDHQINGLRPSPLKLAKDSQTIQKPSSIRETKQPVIIYAHSPKVIHAQPKDFMAVVQKLTGFSQENEATTSDEKDKAEESSKLDGERDQGSFSALSVEKGNPLFADMPIFTPSAGDLVCSPQVLYR